MLDIIYFIIIGGVAGWLAGKIIKGSGYGLLKNILIGIVGAILGGWSFRLLNIEIYGGFWGSLLTATLGSLLLLWILGKTKK